MAEVIGLNKEKETTKSTNSKQEAPNSKQEAPDMEKLAKEHMDMFMKKWKKMNNKDKHETLLNMMLNLAYRMDILASVVSGLKEVKDMKNVFDPNITPPKEKEENND